MATKSKEIAEYLQRHGEAHTFEVQGDTVVVVNPNLDSKAPTAFTPEELEQAVREGCLNPLLAGSAPAVSGRKRYAVAESAE